MICKGCQDKHHEKCKGETWCDCQHKTPPEELPPPAKDC